MENEEWETPLDQMSPCELFGHEYEDDEGNPGRRVCQFCKEENVE